MNFVKLGLDRFGYYAYQDASSIEMNILGNFLSSDVGSHNSIYKEWALHPLAEIMSGNITKLEKENNYVYLSDRYAEKGYFAKLKMTLGQFVEILDDWEQLVCKKKPQEVTIKHINDEFIFETK